MIGRILSQIRNRFSDFSGKPSSGIQPATVYIQSSLQWFKDSLLPEGGAAGKYNLMTHGFNEGYPMSVANWVPLLTRVQQFYPDIYRSVFSDREIAKELVNWLLRIQRRDGTFPGGYGDYMNQAPKVFNNGMIIHGLLDYYNTCGDQDLIEACINSADWLIKVQSPDGSWRQFTIHQLSSNTSTAAALFRLATITGKEEYRKAANKNIEFALGLQSANGYFKGNGFDTQSRAFTITIAYAINGMLECGILESNTLWKESALKAIAPILSTVNQQGFLLGDFDENFQSSSSFSCLPGNCLLAIVGYKLTSLTGNESLKIKSDLLIDYVKRRQIESKNTGIHGGIPGSWPVSGNYCAYEVTSWGVRYFTEAIMMQDVTS